MKLNNGHVTLHTPDGEMDVYFAHPDKLKIPALIVFQEAFGVNEHIKDVCRRYAEQGYFVVAPELYHRHGKHLEFPDVGRSDAMVYLRDLSAESLRMDIQAVLDMLHEIPSVDSSRIATLGFCVGGYTSVFAATEFELSGSIAFYGGGMFHEREGFKLKPLKDHFDKIRHPLLLFFGQTDVSIPVSEVFQIQAILEEEGKAFQSVIFENSDHGFFCDQRKTYNKIAAQDAWEMSLEFLKDVFSPSETHTDDQNGGTLPSLGVEGAKPSAGPTDSAG